MICHLREECGGNVHEKGIVEITASSNRKNQCHQITNYGWNDWWETRDEANSWVRFDFKTRRVYLKSYSLKSDGGSCQHLLRWSIEGSNDGNEWKEIDKRDTQDLNGNYIVKNYECELNRTSEEFYRYLRLRQTGLNSYNNHYLKLSEIEFFGVLQ